MRLASLLAQRAFTRADLAVLLAVCSVVGLVAGSTLAQPQSRSKQAVCASNLQQIGEGFHVWSDDHNQLLPWRVPLAQGGSMIPLRVGNAWFEMMILSNHISSPRLFACPGDIATRRVALDFSNRADRGFLHANFRGNALSYFVGLDAFPISSTAWIAGDRNIVVDQVGVSCSSGVNNAVGLNSRPLSAASGWTAEVHGFQGNLLHFDGHVGQASTEQFRTELGSNDDNGSIHLLLPR